MVAINAIKPKILKLQNDKSIWNKWF